MSKSTISGKKGLGLAESTSAGASAANWASGALTTAHVSNLLEELRAKIAAGIKTSFDTLDTKLDKIQANVSGHRQRISDLKSNAVNVSQRLEQLEATCTALQEDKLLKSKLSDLEGRNRRQNVRIVDLLESVEGHRPFQLLVEVIGDQTLSSPPELDRAHHSLIQKARSQQASAPCDLPFSPLPDKRFSDEKGVETLRLRSIVVISFASTRITVLKC